MKRLKTGFIILEKYEVSSQIFQGKNYLAGLYPRYKFNFQFSMSHFLKYFKFDSNLHLILDVPPPILCQYYIRDHQLF